MMRYITLLVTVLVLCALCSSISANGVIVRPVAKPFPNLHFGTHPSVGDTAEYFPFFQGWNDGKLAWFIVGFDTNNIRTTQWLLPNKGLVPKLTSLIGNAAKPVYVVQGYQQGPVFSARPGEADYSAIWQVIYVKWKPGVTPRPIISDSNLPNASEADQIVTDIVIDLPIIAIGPLGGPWHPAPAGSYRMKQVIDYDPYRKLVTIPLWYAWARDRSSAFFLGSTILRVTAGVMITDVADPTLAALIGANLAPGLNAADAANTQRFWVQDWRLLPPPPPHQFAVLEFLPNFLGRNPGNLNDDFDFSPVMDMVLLQRTGLPAYVVVNNPTFLQSLLPPSGTGFAATGTSIRINATPVFYIPGGI